MTPKRRRKLKRQMEKVAKDMISFAKTWQFDGSGTDENMALLELSKEVHHDSGAVIIFTRDTGHHTSGWLKNQTTSGADFPAAGAGHRPRSISRARQEGRSDVV